jgi:hypothetical protein
MAWVNVPMKLYASWQVGGVPQRFFRTWERTTKLRPLHFLTCFNHEGPDWETRILMKFEGKPWLGII